MLLWVYIVCWILIVLIIIFGSLGVIYNKKKVDCANSPQIYCSDKWACLNTDTKTPTTIAQINELTEADFHNVTLTTIKGLDNIPNQPNAGSLFADCALLTEYTVTSFTYFDKCNKDLNGNPIQLLENPSQYINACKYPKPNCVIIDSDGNPTVDITKCTPEDYVGVGDVFWKACSGKVVCNNGEQVNKCAILPPTV